jgi:signal transduction histidine kinase
MGTVVTPVTQSQAAAPSDPHLMAYFRALPACETPDAALRLTLAGALAMTGAASGAALAAVSPAKPLTAGAPNAGIAAQIQAAWAAAAGDPAFFAPADPAPPESAPDAPRYVPLAAGGRLYGLLGLCGVPALDPITVDALDVMAAATGRALQMSINLDELRGLYEVATALNSTLELPVLLKLIVKRTTAALRSEACTLMLLDERTQELVFEIPVGRAENALRQLRMPLSQGICGWVARNARPAIVNDPRADERFHTSVDQSSGFVTRNALAVPLILRGRVGGVVEVLNKLGNEPYSAHDVELLTTLAGQAAVALDNAQLYTSLQTEHERLLAAEEQVRKELARDLHDGPAQRMAAICMEVEILRKLLVKDPSRLPEELDALETLARKANREVRTMQFQLRPVMLETRGLRAAIEYYVNQLRETERIAFTVEAEGCEDRLPANVEQAAFGIVQEALGNIRKHSGANNATVRMREEPGYWRITIVDDGHGFDVATVLRAYETRGSLGLLNMRERAQAAGGELDLSSVAGQGTTVSLVIPSAGSQHPMSSEVSA